MTGGGEGGIDWPAARSEGRLSPNPPSEWEEGQTSAGGSAEAGNLAVSVQWRSLFPPSPENPQRPQWGDEGLRGQSLSNAELWATAVQAAGPVPSVQAKAA